MIQKIRKFIINDQFLHNKINLFLLVFLIVLNLVVWLFWVFLIQPLGYSVFLSLEIPIDSLRNYTLPILGSIFSVLNFGLAYYACKKQVLLGFYLMSAGILVEILILVLIRHYLLIVG